MYNIALRAVHFTRTWDMNFSVSDAGKSTFLMTRREEISGHVATFHFSCLCCLHTLCTSVVFALCMFYFNKIAFVCLFFLSSEEPPAGAENVDPRSGSRQTFSEKDLPECKIQ